MGNQNKIPSKAPVKYNSISKCIQSNDSNISDEMENVKIFHFVWSFKGLPQLRGKKIWKTHTHR